MKESIAAVIADVSRLMRRSFDARARKIGVTRPQWQVLTVLRRHEGINQGRLAELLEVEAITVCRMVDRLEEAGLVDRQADPSDRRAWRLFLTVKAERLMDRLRPLAGELVEEALAGLDAAERADLYRMLDEVRQNLTRKTPEERAHG
ncbi:MAG: MarR family transcriptional regulator [Parvularculaceae bacterium]|nr:MarR family transcriptional regulator [Parvularculaceae bacterium]